MPGISKGKGRKHSRQTAGIMAVIMCQILIPVGQIAFAVSGGQKLFADPVIAL